MGQFQYIYYKLKDYVMLTVEAFRRNLRILVSSQKFIGIVFKYTYTLIPGWVRVVYPMQSSFYFCREAMLPPRPSSHQVATLR